MKDFIKLCSVFFFSIIFICCIGYLFNGTIIPPSDLQRENTLNAMVSSSSIETYKMD